MVKQIDLDELIAGKNPRLAKKMPGFVKACLRRILHLKEINEFLAEHHQDRGLVFAEAGMKFVDLKLQVIGEEYLADARRPLLVSNHPLGGLDGVALLTLVGRYHGTVKLLVNDFLMAIENLQELFVPVNKHGSSRRYKQQLDEAIASDDPLLIFPAGLCSRKLPYGIYDLEWNKSFVKMARESRRPVIPIYVAGKNSNFFYNLARFRHRLGIKGNFEMLFLVNEMMKQQHLSMAVVVGEPIDSTLFTPRYDDWIWARRLREFVYSMSDSKTAAFDPDAELKLPESYYG